MSSTLYYVMACDERGTTRWPHASKTWAMGGLVVERIRMPQVVSAWEDIKLHLCGSKKVELKWSHFFPGPHQKRIFNPLRSSSPQEWRRQLIWALNMLFKRAEITPITTVVRKDKASNAMFMKEKPNGTKILDIDVLWLGVVGQFAVFLQHMEAYGEIWFDRLGSRKEEARKQADWRRIRDQEWPLNGEHQEILKRISPSLKFFDSEEEPLIQVADFVSGVLWAAAEGDEEFLLNFFKEYFPWGKDTYTFMYLV